MQLPPKQRYKLQHIYTPERFAAICTPTYSTDTSFDMSSVIVNSPKPNVPTEAQVSPPLPDEPPKNNAPSKAGTPTKERASNLPATTKPSPRRKNSAFDAKKKTTATGNGNPPPTRERRTQPTAFTSTTETTLECTYVLDEAHVLIAVFNVKGGVAKTTVSINLAYALARSCNVLLTEVDPQCNIRQFFARELPLNQEDSDAESESESESTAAPPTTPPRGIVLLRRPYHPSERSSKFKMTRQSARFHKSVLALPKDTSAPDVVFDNNLYDATRNYMMGGGRNEIPTCHELPSPQSSNKVWFLPGSQQIIDLERSLSLKDCDTSGLGHHQVGAFRRMMIDTMKSLDCRVAIVDFGPHSGLLNRVLVTSCDLIIPPCFPDSLSYNASKTLLQTVIPNWFEWFDMFANLPQNTALKRKLPFILPFIVTNFHTRSNSMFKSASAWAAKLQALSTNDERVNRQRIPVEISAFEDPIVDSNVICISRHEEGLNGTAHTRGVPIIDLGLTGLSKAQQHAVAETRAEFMALAGFIIDVISHKSQRTIAPPRKRKRTTTTQAYI